MKVSVPALVCGECHTIITMIDQGYGSICRCGVLEMDVGPRHLNIISYRGQAPYWMSVEIEVEEPKQ